MKKVAKFEKVDLKQFMDDWISTFGNRPDHIITEIYNNIKLPERKTQYSAGHDIYMPCDITLQPDEVITIPTGIRCIMENEYVMLIFPRSSLGIKKNMFITNTIPVIDADYFMAANQGHIFICIKNCGRNILRINAGDSFSQAIFVSYGVADEEEVLDKRMGGIGSTTK